MLYKQFSLDSECIKCGSSDIKMEFKKAGGWYWSSYFMTVDFFIRTCNRCTFNWAEYPDYVTIEDFGNMINPKPASKKLSWIAKILTR